MADSIVVDFDPERFPKARRVLNAAFSGKYRVIIMGGAVRGGKSFGIGGTIMMLLNAHAGTRAIVVRDTLQTLRNTTLPTVEKLMPAFPVKRFKGDPQFQWTFRNGSTFQFFSEQDDTDPERKRWDGLEVNYIWLEQVEGLQKKTLDKALERVGSYFVPKHIGPTPPPIIFVTLNPTDDWPRDMFYEKWVNSQTGLPNGLPENWLYVDATIFDNGGLEQSYFDSLDELKYSNPAWYKRYVQGNWDVREKTGGEWYHQFDYNKHTGKAQFLPELIGEVHGTFDFNTVPYMTLLCFQLQRIGSLLRIRFFQEYCLKNPDNTTAKLCGSVKKDYLLPYRKSFTYHGDRQGENRVEGEGNFRRFDRVRTVLQPFLHNRSNQVNKAVVVSDLYRDFINDVLAGKVANVEIIIDEENCPELIKDLANSKEAATGIKKEKGKDANGVSYEKNGHCLSAFTYGVGAVLFQYEFAQWKRQRGRLVEN